MAKLKCSGFYSDVAPVWAIAVGLPSNLLG